MKVTIIKEHPSYPLGEVEVSTERANYLIKVGIAEEVKEKVQHTPAKEKKEITKPTSKK